MEHKTVLIIASLLVSIFTVSKWYQVHSISSGCPCGSVISISEWIPAPSLNIMLMRLSDHLWFCFSLFGFFCTSLCFAYARSLVFDLAAYLHLFCCCSWTVESLFNSLQFLCIHILSHNISDTQTMGWKNDKRKIGMKPHAGMYRFMSNILV